MNIYLTFDVEIWCDGWAQLDRRFPDCYERYVYGRSPRGEWALPKTLEILQSNGLRGVFFVEPLFSARFGGEYLERIVRMIREGGQDVQLHLHPEWTDEIRPPLIADCARKRQHLTYYTLDEQTALIGHARRLLEAAGSGSVSAFRAGSFAANRDTYEALRRNHIQIDSSPNRYYEVSVPDMRGFNRLDAPFREQSVSVYPVTLFKDGLGKERPAQVNGSSFQELRDAMARAQASAVTDFVIVSHNFEMLKPGSSLPDPWVVRRFQRLCAWLREHAATCPTRSFEPISTEPGRHPQRPVVQASLPATGMRYAEQLLRRFI